MKKPHPSGGKKSKKAPPNSKARPEARNRCRTLAMIDEQPLRRKAVAECQRLEGLMAKARTQLEAFETGDLPAFQRWEASVLGPLLTEARTIEEQIAEKERILDAIDEEALWSDCSRVAAYRKVMKRRQEGRPLDGSDEEPHGGTDDSDGDFDPDGDGPDGEFGPDGEASFFPPGFSPGDYDRMSAAKKRDFREYYESLAELFEMMTGEQAPPLEEALERERARLGGKGGAHGAAHGAAHGPSAAGRGATESAPKSRDAKRIKELYRGLVRQLHPDANRKLTPREKELWHQVQEAYRTQDLERMEALAGRVEMGVNGESKNVPVQFLRRMARDLAESLRGLRKQLDAARKHQAWNFRQRSADLSKFEGQRRKEMLKKVYALRQALTHLEMDLKELEAHAGFAAAPPLPKREGKKKRDPGGDARQGTFSF